MMNNRNLIEKPESNFNDLTKLIGKQIKLLNKASKTGSFEKVYTDELLYVLQYGKINLNNLISQLKLLAKEKNKLEKDTKERLFDFLLTEYETLKQNLINLIFVINKVQDTEWKYLKLDIDPIKKYAINELIYSIKQHIFKDSKEKDELSKVL